MRQKNYSRRHFLNSLVTGTTLAGMSQLLPACKTSKKQTLLKVPSYLSDYEKIYQENPKKAALNWFSQARFGMFIHYGLYSLLGRHEWVMLRERIPLAEYEKLKSQFTAEKFDANFITDLAQAAQMKYITITSKHHDGFCLFATKQHDYHAKASPAGRDLIAELSAACQKKGLGLFLYYSYAADWWHPYFYSRDAGWNNARPAYEQPEPRYEWRKDQDFKIYVDYVHSQLRELLTNYGPIAGIWFDPIMGYYARPDLFPIEETYALIRSLQPQTLISFKQGASGNEDFAAPERSGHSLYDRVKKMYPQNADIAKKAWEGNQYKHNEICDTLQPGGWGYIKKDDGMHKKPDEVMGMLANAATQKMNLLLNTGPLGDGSIHPEDIDTLRNVGRQIQQNGFPIAKG